MKGILLQSILLSSLALVQASPTPSDPIELDIPLDNILSRNLSAFSSHPLFAVYEAWVSRNPNMSFLHDGDSSVKTDHPALNGVVCTESSQNCFLSSSVTIPGTTPVGIRSPLTKRADAIAMSVSTHWKTYFEGQEGGHEHYTTWNLKCGRLEYKGTGFVLDHDENKRYSDNDIATKAFVYEYRVPSHKVTLQQNFKCSFFGNKCCGSYYTATSTGSGKITSWTWECTSSRDAPACQG
ncbi:MAG: hypothetical protein M1813_001007 [Trichoglossum hirsutum]|jgi:hypothetical protein|nr:MAG: hypothetical protein M1813_001007 [Trichoglossum hirsutum]